MSKFRLCLLMIIFVASMFFIQGCGGGALPPSSPEENLESFEKTVEGLAIVFDAEWRSRGNAALILHSDDSAMAYVVDLEQDQYPPDEKNDTAFLTRDKIQERFSLTDLQEFTLRCGQNQGAPLSTDIVFWTENYWEGSRQSFSCGGSGDVEDYEINGAIRPDEVGSICIVSDITVDKRSNRCLTGPLCDDERKNGDESDIDCGEVCEFLCREGERCNSSRDCRSNYCRKAICTEPTCNDGVKNQNETDIDCGGDCKKCDNNRGCRTGVDCKSGNCEQGKCVPKRTCNGEFETDAAKHYDIAVKYPWGCGDVAVDIFANSLSDAKQCVQSEGLTPVSKLCEYELWSSDWNAVTFYRVAPTKEDAIDCVRYTDCANCRFSIVNEGNCVSFQ